MTESQRTDEGPAGADAGAVGSAHPFGGVRQRDGQVEPGTGAQVPPPGRDAAPEAGSPLEPLAWSSARIVLGGLVLWAVALVVTLAVPALHTGDRDWWPRCCVAGLVLGSVGYAYMRRGRGNAAGAL
ncbi:DUF2530 domain-containing protein [Pedococcus sp. NPDC057267]|uniref:DUF2530 domain-containing protein n=1 Tax=Pedococcus sp. NPDC057267 TaxID=3346077 RepID=UPI0036281BD5